MKHLYSAALFCACLQAVPSHGAEEPVDFVRQIKPIIADRCVECHNSENFTGNLNLQSRQVAMQKRKEGPVIVPGAPEKSRFYLTLTLPVKDTKAMPATAHRLPKSDIETVRLWITQGAGWPDGEEGHILPRGARRKGL